MSYPVRCISIASNTYQTSQQQLHSFFTFLRRIYHERYKVGVSLILLDHSILFSDLRPNTTFNFRIVPITQAGSPSDIALQSTQNFPWTPYTLSTDTNYQPSPSLSVVRINSTVWSINWETNHDSNSEISMSYRPLYSVDESSTKTRLFDDNTNSTMLLADELQRGIP